MKKLPSNDSLNEAIALLEMKRDKELMELKQQLEKVGESLKPINIIKDTLKEIKSSPDIKDGIGKTVVGVASGFLVKNILFGNTYNPMKIIAGLAIQTAASNFGSNHYNNIRSVGHTLLYSLASKLKNRTKKISVHSELQE